MSLQTGRPGTLAGAVPDVESARLPDPPRLFARRAARFRMLAGGHAVAGYLEFLGDLVVAQARAVPDMEAALLGSAPRVSQAAGSDPPFPARRPADLAWRAALHAIVASLEEGALRPQSLDALRRVATASTGDLERWSEAVLGGEQAALDPGPSLFVAAALQVYWSCLAARTRPVAAPARGTCPVCGSRPVAGLVHGDSRLRSLACALCGCEWHLTRLTCSGCLSPSSLSYLTVDGALVGTKAEACAACHTYVKLFYLDELPSAEAVADDVASVVLDLLMAEEGYARAGVNLLLLPG